MKIQCILCDDESLARKGVENFIREIPFLELTDRCGSAFELMEVLANKKTDLLFLDIQMPKMTGMEFLKSASEPPMTIITTAYSNFAIESFNFTVIDYLLKPIPFSRFVKAVNKAKDYYEMQLASLTGQGSAPDHCFIKCDKSYEKVYYMDILYVEAFVNYVVIHTKGKKFVTYLTLKAVEDHLPATMFVKINKSYLVSHLHVERIEGNEVVVAGRHLLIGRTFKQHVMELLLNNKLIKR